MKHKTLPLPLRTRELPPIAKPLKDGMVLLCPFCQPTHPIIPGKPSVCGSELRVTVVQRVISARVARMQKLTCVKCRQVGGGEMVQYMNGYIHLKDCAPEIKLLSEIPQYSKWAARVYRLPEKVRNLVEKLTGTVQAVHGLDTEGRETDQMEGYFFSKA